MKRISLLAFCGALLTFPLSAARPTCKTEKQKGQLVEVCERADVMCESLTAEQQKSPSDKWTGCSSPAILIKGDVTLAGLLIFSTQVSVVPSYRDSKRVDMTVTFENPDHTFQKYERKDVPVIVQDGTPSASAEFITQMKPVGVPTVEATEKGGAKGASHSYK
jgi:hypothetical protein